MMEILLISIYLYLHTYTKYHTEPWVGYYRWNKGGGLYMEVIDGVGGVGGYLKRIGRVRLISGYPVGGELRGVK